MKNEKEAFQYLDTVETELARVSADAVHEIDSVKAAVESHETALAKFEESGLGLLPSIEARNFLRTFDETLFPGMTALGGTGNDNRRNYFRFERPRLELVAKGNYVRTHGPELSVALETIIAARSKGREAWRDKMADKIQTLEKRQLLGEVLTITEARELESLERNLIVKDEIYHEAIRLARRLKTAPTWETWTDLKAISGQVSFEDA